MTPRKCRASVGGAARVDPESFAPLAPRHRGTRRLGKYNRFQAILRKGHESEGVRQDHYRRLNHARIFNQRVRIPSSDVGAGGHGPDSESCCRPGRRLAPGCRASFGGQYFSGPGRRAALDVDKSSRKPCAARLLSPLRAPV
jgi:hypothetical protein